MYEHNERRGQVARMNQRALRVLLMTSRRRRTRWGSEVGAAAPRIPAFSALHTYRSLGVPKSQTWVGHAKLGRSRQTDPRSALSQVIRVQALWSLTMNTDRRCASCGAWLQGRMDRTTCSDACRQRVNRRPPAPEAVTPAPEAVTAPVTSGPLAVTRGTAPVARGGTTWADDDDDDDELGHWIPVR